MKRKNLTKRRKMTKMTKKKRRARMKTNHCIAVVVPIVKSVKLYSSSSINKSSL
jgi:hypothetical protein